MDAAGRFRLFALSIEMKDVSINLIEVGMRINFVNSVPRQEMNRNQGSTRVAVTVVGMNVEFPD